MRRSSPKPRAVRRFALSRRTECLACSILGEPVLSPEVTDLVLHRGSPKTAAGRAIIGLHKRVTQRVNRLLRPRFLCGSLIVKFQSRHGVESQFHPVRHTQLIEDPEQVILDGVFAQPQLISNLAVHHSLHHKPHY